MKEYQDTIHGINTAKLSNNEKELKIKALNEEIKMYLKMGLR